MECIVCGNPARIHETDKDASTESSWCLRHAPECYADTVAEMRAYDAWAMKWATWISERKAASKPIPSWRMLAANAFRAGIEFANGKR